VIPTVVAQCDVRAIFEVFSPTFDFNGTCIIPSVAAGLPLTAEGKQMERRMSCTKKCLCLINANKSAILIILPLIAEGQKQMK